MPAITAAANPGFIGNRVAEPALSARSRTRLPPAPPSSTRRAIAGERSVLLDSQPLTSLYQLDRDLGRPALIAALAAMPGRIAAAVEGLSEAALASAPSPEAWSGFQVCCHVRDAAFVYSVRFRWIVFDDRPFLPNYDEGSWVAASRDTVADLPAIMAELRASRADLVRVLSRMPESAWQRTGRHEVLGAVTLEPYVRHQLTHEEMHVAQLEKALRK